MTAPRNDWQTPPEFMLAIERAFGWKPDGDTAADEHNRKAPLWMEGPHIGPVNCLCGLCASWKDPRPDSSGVWRAWNNPPYTPSGQVRAWVSKAIQEVRSCSPFDAGLDIFQLLPANPGSEWWGMAWSHAHEIWTPRPRIPFLEDGVMRPGNRADNTLLRFRSGPAPKQPLYGVFEWFDYLTFSERQTIRAAKIRGEE